MWHLLFGAVSLRREGLWVLSLDRRVSFRERTLSLGEGLERMSTSANALLPSAASVHDCIREGKRFASSEVAADVATGSLQLAAVIALCTTAVQAPRDGFLQSPVRS